jgi:hypothetical protein
MGARESLCRCLLIGVGCRLGRHGQQRVADPGRISGRDRAGLIDAAIIATGLGLLSWAFLMKPIAADPSLSLTERLISLAYPLGDVLLLVMVARLATSPGARTVAGWLLSSVVCGTAALHPSMRPLSEVAPTGPGGSPTGGWPCWRRRR